MPRLKRSDAERQLVASSGPEFLEALTHGGSAAGKHRGLARGGGKMHLAWPLGDSRGTLALGGRCAPMGEKVVRSWNRPPTPLTHLSKRCEAAVASRVSWAPAAP